MILWINSRNNKHNKINFKNHNKKSNKNSVFLKHRKENSPLVKKKRLSKPVKEKLFALVKEKLSILVKEKLSAIVKENRKKKHWFIYYYEFRRALDSFLPSCILDHFLSVFGFYFKTIQLLI